MPQHKPSDDSLTQDANGIDDCGREHDKVEVADEGGKKMKTNQRLGHTGEKCEQDDTSNGKITTNLS